MGVAPYRVLRFPLLLSPSRSLTHLLPSPEHPSSFLLFLSPLRARSLSFLVVHSRGAYNPTLRRRPRLVVIAYTCITGRASALRDPATILRPNS